MSAEQLRPLGTIEPSEVDRFWMRFTAQHDIATDAVYAEAFQFGDDGSLADKLFDLVARGPKRATADIVAGLDASGGNVPAVGDLWIACRGDGTPAIVIRTTDVRVGPLSSVDEEFAWDEGEGDRTREDWMRIHTDCFARGYERLGLEMHADIAVVFERFELVYAES